MFPDATEPSKNNGGVLEQEEFRELTLDRIVEENRDIEPTLVTRTSNVKLRDYQGSSLQRAFHSNFHMDTAKENATH
jgi:hypothetical protein